LKLSETGGTRGMAFFLDTKYNGDRGQRNVLSPTEYLLMSAILLNVNRSYGKEIFESAEKLGKPHGVSLAYGSLYPTLDRLVSDGLLKTEMGEPTNTRGGKARRLYTVTGAGSRAMQKFERMPLEVGARLREVVA
jgi:PadR family transcriptional regulator, regulatory protein PadR